MTFVIGTPHTHHCGHVQMWTGGLNSKHIELDMQSCSHCQRAIDLRKWRDECGAFCHKCMKPVCGDGPCAALTEAIGCVPWMKRLETWAEREGNLANFRKLAGLDPQNPVRFVIIGDHQVPM